MNFEEALFRKLELDEKIPYDLLLLADPSVEVINLYIYESQVFVLEYDNQIVGVIAFLNHSENTAEIKNIAVRPDYQGKGIGSYLLHQINTIAIESGIEKLIVGTADSSKMQLQFYNKNGFYIDDVLINYFLDNYPDPIFENGQRALHMIVLMKNFNSKNNSGINLLDFIPRHKSDFESFNSLQKYDIKSIRPIFPLLLEWLSDINWPVAKPIAEYLTRNFSTTQPFLYAIFKSEDEVWKYWILVVFGKMIDDIKLKTEILRIYECPTTTEKKEEVHIIAMEIVDFWSN